jgi:hypothetical protein
MNSLGLKMSAHPYMLVNDHAKFNTKRLLPSAQFTPITKNETHAKKTKLIIDLNRLSLLWWIYHSDEIYQPIVICSSMSNQLLAISGDFLYPLFLQ